DPCSGERGGCCGIGTFELVGQADIPAEERQAKNCCHGDSCSYRPPTRVVGVQSSGHGHTRSGEPERREFGAVAPQPPQGELAGRGAELVAVVDGHGGADAVTADPAGGAADLMGGGAAGHHDMSWWLAVRRPWAVSSSRR